MNQTAHVLVTPNPTWGFHSASLGNSGPLDPSADCWDQLCVLGCRDGSLWYIWRPLWVCAKERQSCWSRVQIDGFSFCSSMSHLCSGKEESFPGPQSTPALAPVLSRALLRLSPGWIGGWGKDWSAGTIPRDLSPARWKGVSWGHRDLHFDAPQPGLQSGPEAWHWVALMNGAAGQLVYCLTCLLALPAAASYSKWGEAT